MRRFLLSGILMLVIGGTSVFAQDPYNDLTQNRPAIKNLTADGLKDLVDNNPVELEKMKYLYTRSFDVELIGCPSCEIDYVDLFNIALFDVTELSSIRNRSEVYEFDFKNKYHITLYSEKAILQRYNAIEQSMSTERLSVSAPVMELKGDIEANYSKYKKDLAAFRVSDPVAYDVMVSDNRVLKMPFDEFVVLPAEKRESVINHSHGYLITE